jgi:predicted dehydrogenase/threonine dehydrogenase-like Zn-dependent dehydrogenase
MRQIVTSLKTGATTLEIVPQPRVAAGELLIAARRSLVSQGTERMLVQFGKASLFQKARSQPEKVRQVLGKIKTDGLWPTIEAVFRRLDEPLPLGYCHVGSVIEVGSGVQGFQVGDRIASNGPHAEVVSVPANLCAKVPAEVSDDAASFTVIGAIALQGVRMVRPEFGETVVVVGLGLIGQITVQLLVAAGCRVIGFDFDEAKVALARQFRVDAQRTGGDLDPVSWAVEQTGGLGVDAVIITAATSSNEVIAQCARMSRKRGRIVLVGVVGLALNRADFYEKELTFQVSCSYGPGRYDDNYEEKGFDYPLAYVRWTENRNFQAVLAAIAKGSLKVEPLITKRVPLVRYEEIYANMDGGGLASLLVYPAAQAQAQINGSVGLVNPIKVERTDADALSLYIHSPRKPSESASTVRVSDRDVGSDALALIGAGNFAKMTAMPALGAVKAPVKTIVSSGGVNGTSLARKYKVPFSSTDYSAVLADQEIRGIIITTRHNLHAYQVVAALRAGKNVLVEKPLCLTLDELRSIEEVLMVEASRSSDSGGQVGVAVDPCGTGRLSIADESSWGPENPTQTLNSLDQLKPHLSATPIRLCPWVSVGYNRRFSPHIEKMKALLADNSGPVSLVATMNAGAIPLKHWVHDPEVGGGRIIGEACHFVDLAIYLTGSLIVEVSAVQLEGNTDCVSIVLRHANGSTSVVNYFAHGHREVSKERIELHSLGRTLLLDNFREMRGYGFRSFSKLKTRLDKGHQKQFAVFARRVKEGGPPLIPWEEIRNGTLAVFAVRKAVAERRVISLAEMQ